jgi:hypothetical protein
VVVDGAVDGLYLAFESFLASSLRSSRWTLNAERFIRSLPVHEETGPAGTVAVASVFVPDGTLGHFMRRLEEYAATVTDRKPKNANLVDRIAAVRLASVRALWTDAAEDCLVLQREIF